MEIGTWKMETGMWKKENEASPPRLPASMTSYTEAVDEFSRHATEFLAYMPLLTKARDAYQRAMAVSAEVRSMLDTGDGTLRALMAQMEDAVAFHLGKTASGKKNPESVKFEPTVAPREGDDSTWSLPK
jgi:exonuclease VII small subunit